ncbi:MAG: phospholipase D-like domain-containing protein [Syntrophales bacterium]|nr:phospholipase D-like domain-containing protein [Syntrophales bacterium]
MRQNNKALFCMALCCSFIISLLFPLNFALSGQAGAAGKGKLPPSFQGCSVTILENRDYFPALKDAIDRANKEITLSSYHFKTKGPPGNYPNVILTSLMDAAKRGVKVTILLEQSRDDTENTGDNRETMGKLRKAGLIVYLDTPEKTTHTKMAVVDGKYTFIGSHNLTQSGLQYNNEISVLIDSPQAAAEASDYIKSLIP